MWILSVYTHVPIHPGSRVTGGAPGRAKGGCLQAVGAEPSISPGFRFILGSATANRGFLRDNSPLAAPQAGVTVKDDEKQTGPGKRRSDHEQRERIGKIGADYETPAGGGGLSLGSPANPRQSSPLRNRGGRRGTGGDRQRIRPRAPGGVGGSLIAGGI